MDLKSLTIHKGSMMNSLSPLGPMMDWIGGSTSTRPSLETFGLSISKPLSLEEGEVVDELLSSLEMSGSF